ncbi:2-phosphosulfolactate phosphatase [Rubinisphaera margarita]|uniref:2-phosphosulfolactate phosphatase n=1 Tax=Rubinisphaera margarita TaxID=2909586 RepID=UPI001EE85CF8|nr:2-phosphosulfolactate phosphatase [Rubinisphaera margarita]MCG6157482.1 2-phosphosulfolactate phosphatase [Rubinisphaera margarita]
MPQSLATCLLPQLATPEILANSRVVVIDILRASSTICTALANGSEVVIPCEDVETAHQLKRDAAANPPLLGGERGGVKLPDFDLGNSPREYDEETVSGRSIVFTTTNGTRALHRSVSAAQVAVGCFLNCEAVVDWLESGNQPVVLMCAGTDGHITLEDCLFAGLLADRLVQRNQQLPIDDPTRICLDVYHTAASRLDGTLLQLRSSRGGQNLQNLGMGEDINYCAQVDILDLVPVWDPTANRITPLK